MERNFLKQLTGNHGATFRLVAVLAITFVVIAGSKLWEDSYIESLRNDCSSLFSDRLVPATTLFHLSDEIHRKRHTLTIFLRDGEVGKEESIDYLLGQHDASIEHHIATIEHTYLVDDESRLLKELRKTLSSYDKMERALLARHHAGEKVDYDAEIQASFTQVRAELLGLTEVQQTVGKQLKSDSAASATHVTSLLYFQLGVAFILGLVASGLAMSLGPRSSSSAPNGKDEGLH